MRASDKEWFPTYEPLVLSEPVGGTATQFPSVYFAIDEGLSDNILDLVYPWLQFSIFEDG